MDIINSFKPPKYAILKRGVKISPILSGQIVGKIVISPNWKWDNLRFISWCDKNNIYPANDIGKTFLKLAYKYDLNPHALPRFLPDLSVNKSI